MIVFRHHTGQVDDRFGSIDHGALIFNPFKFNKTECRLYSLSHFHLVGFGTSSDIQNAFGR
ncbi:MAG: hypothetical protein WEB01_04725 [Nitrosopumilus sp.]